MTISKKEVNILILKIIIPILITILTHAGGTIWWASATESRLNFLEEETIDRYFGKDARARAKQVDFRFSRNEDNINNVKVDLKQDITELKADIKSISDKLDKYVFRQ